MLDLGRYHRWSRDIPMIRLRMVLGNNAAVVSSTLPSLFRAFVADIAALRTFSIAGTAAIGNTEQAKFASP
jgi:hypothetical protein